MGSARVTSFAEPSIFPIIAPQHSLGKVASACATITFQASGSTLIICVYLRPSAAELLFVPERRAVVLGRAVVQHGDDHAGTAFVDQAAADGPRGVDVRAG